LVSTVSHDTEYRSRIVAKFLQTIERHDIPVGIGISTSSKMGAQQSWVHGYNLKKYPGIVHDDAVKAIADIILRTGEKITIICIGAFTNIAALLRRYPGIERNIRIVAMCGSIYQNIEGQSVPIPECNIVEDVSAAQAVFGRDIDITIAPVDVCRSAKLTGDDYAAVKNSSFPIPKMIMEQYQNWTVCHPELNGCPEQYSSILWDTVAAHMAMSTEFLGLETLGIRIDEKGYTRIDAAAKPVQCALRWTNLAAFKKRLVKTLTRPTMVLAKS
jgi:inosine-uridine nucleoside N-ribohydrolase